MKPTGDERDPLPGGSAPYEEIAEFWDTHDTTDYLDEFQDADVVFDIQSRAYEIQVPKEVYELLSSRAASLNKPVQTLIEEALRKECITSG
ncbi:MAG: hypothetical protein HYV26_10745 [Candidatus Hydrogenedentes bacterium]|nr:hypothetical protein [Candidatus Hydrogenedentota bacterium]